MSLDKVLASLIDEAARAKKNAQDIGAFLKSGKLKKYAEPATSIYNADAKISGFYFTYDRIVFFKVNVNALVGFTDPRLEGILNSFEYLNPDNTSVTESAGNLTKEFRYEYRIKFNDSLITVVIEVAARVKEDSPTCRKEVVGYTDPKPAPIYKIVCDDGADTPALTTEREPIDHLADDVLTQDDVGV